MESEMDLQRERAAFEAVTNTYHCIYNADLNYYFSGSKFTGDKAETEVNAGWKAWQTAKSQAIPEGFVLVLKEPTAEILKVGHETLIGAYEMGLSNDECIKHIYQATIEAAQELSDD